MYSFFVPDHLARNSQKTFLDLYRSTNPLIFTLFFGECISRNRFLLLIKYLHFTEKEGASNEPTYKF